MLPRHKVSMFCWKNGANTLVPGRIATDLQFIKNAISVMYNEATHNKRNACTEKQSH